MKRIFILNSALLFVILIILSSAVMSQDDMKPPQPIDNATIKMLMGTWNADPYDMMGSKWNETAVHTMKHNGQYMFVDITGSNDKNQTYTSTVIITADKDGNITGWSFDDWGGGVTTYSGKSDGNKASVTGISSWGTEVRNIEINGNTMTHKVNWTMKDKDGKDMTMNQTIIYHKQ